MAMGAESRYTVTVEQGTLVRVTWAPAIVLHHSDGALLTADIESALPRRRVHLLMLLNGMASLSQAALAYFAKRAPLSAVALVGPSVLDQPLIELYVELYQPPFPVGYFETEATASSWLMTRPELDIPLPR
ncbi:hypothetical protein E8P82_08635 [Arthrobacter echini]|uniref:DUF7793 domain-containing protein n=1 Tax=Arthrobacter echini TaxID=1529066 RepID=A0A4S5E509_9MICC|nr:hypothetical protein [Arthrobacter echini]THJ66510.1 hypothetical protein E8P82_08635 [Arthrobacter echini]